MLEKFLGMLVSELALPAYVNLEKGKRFSLLFAPEIEVILVDLQPGVSMYAMLAPNPAKKKEEIFIYLMRANLLGQGTSGSRIGMDATEKNLTLALGIPYEIDYSPFKERFEEFINHVIYWRKIIADFEHEQTIIT